MWDSEEDEFTTDEEASDRDYEGTHLGSDDGPDTIY
jgi:hypothetical protein